MRIISAELQDEIREPPLIVNEQDDILAYETESDPETDINESDDDYLPDCDSELDRSHISASDYDSDLENNAPQTSLLPLNSKLLRCYSITEGKMC